MSRSARAIAVLAKVPLPGTVKTRLIPALGERAATSLAAAFIGDLSVRLARIAAELGADVKVYYAPGDARFEIERLTEPLECRAQREGDLGSRLDAVLGDLESEGYREIVLVGADAPTLPGSLIHGAFDALDGGVDLALAPADDGGFVLAALAHRQPSLFEGIPWSTGDVHRVTVERANRLGLRVQELSGWYDVDDAAGLQRLRAELESDARHEDVPETRRLLVALDVGDGST